MCPQDKYQFAKRHSCSKPAFTTGWKHTTLTIGIKCSLPKQLRNGDFVAKPFCPFSNYLPLNFMLQFKKGKSYLKIANPTSKGLTIKAGTALGCASFESIRDLSQCVNTTTHLHQDYGNSAMCSLSMSACPINYMLGIVCDIAHSRTCQNPYNHTPQSHDYPTCAESLHMSKHCHHQNNANSTEFIDNKHELIMKDYYSHNQDKMSPAQIRELNWKSRHFLTSVMMTLDYVWQKYYQKRIRSWHWFCSFWSR